LKYEILFSNRAIFFNGTPCHKFTITLRLFKNKPYKGSPAEVNQTPLFNTSFCPLFVLVSMKCFLPYFLWRTFFNLVSLITNNGVIPVSCFKICSKRYLEL